MDINKQIPRFYEFDTFRLDTVKRLLLRDNESISLMPKAIDTLLILLSRHGQVVSKDELMKSVWSDTVVEENNLNINISVLRKALGEKPRENRFIATVPGVGYKFVTSVREIFENDEEPVYREYAVENQAFPGEIEDISIPADVNKTKYGNRLFLIVFPAAIVLAVLAYYLINARNSPGESLSLRQAVQLTSWSGMDFYPAISPDGNSIAFSSDRSGNFEIYTKQLVAGAREVQITSDGGQNFEPAFSPDGSLIAFYSKNRGGIWVVPATGGTANQVTKFGSFPAWSPDGSLIAFQSDSINSLAANSNNALPPSTIWIVPAKGGEEPRRLTQPGNPGGGHGSPVWLPGGKRLLFLTNDLIQNDVWSVSIEGGDLKKFFVDVEDIACSPDNKSVFFNSGGYLQKAGVSETGDLIGTPVKIYDSSGSRMRFISVANKSRRIVYTSTSTFSNIWSTPLNPLNLESAGAPAQLTKTTNARSVTPAFSFDGKKIAYALSITGTWGQIWTMDADGGNPVQIVSQNAGFPWWFSNDYRVAYRFVNNRDNFFRAINVNNGKIDDFFKVDKNMSYTRISPDGKQVAFNSIQSGTLNIWTIPIEGGQPRQLTFDAELMGFPAWSPDGEWIAFQMKRGENAQIGIIPSKGGEPVQLTFDKGQSWGYDWSPDGDKILFSGQRDNIWNVYWVSRSTGQQKQLTNFTKPNSYVRYPAWSPRNDKIAYEYTETTGNIWMIELGSEN